MDGRNPATGGRWFSHYNLAVYSAFSLCFSLCFFIVLCFRVFFFFVVLCRFAHAFLGGLLVLLLVLFLMLCVWLAMSCVGCQSLFDELMYWVCHCVSLEDLRVKLPRFPWKRNLAFFTLTRAFSGALLVPTDTANRRYTNDTDMNHTLWCWT